MKQHILYNKYFYLTIILSLYFSTCFSQMNYQFPETFDSSYYFHPENAKKDLLNGEKDEDKILEKQSYLTRYVYNEQFGFDNNTVYMNWPVAERYLIRLLDTIIGKTRSQHLDIFLKRSHIENAAASRYGNIYMNMGFLATAENEALLASVIAHETAHYIFQHKIKELKEEEKTFAYGAINFDRLGGYLKLPQKFETQADSFAASKLQKLGYSMESTLEFHESENAREDFFRNDRSFKTMLRASNLSDKEIAERKRKRRNDYASHPSYIARYDAFKKQSEKCISCNKAFVIDSVFFMKLKKTAKEEVKKIAFEACQFDECIQFTLLDYLYGVKHPKNFYYLIESLRRLMYIKPELKREGFLTEKIEDPDLGPGRCVLYKPEYFYRNLKDYEHLKNHPFIINTVKPFNTYKEAFLFFSKEALKAGFNETNLSLALFYSTEKQRDSVTKYLTNYVSNNGLHSSFAKEFLVNGKPKISKGKTLVLYNNITNYTGFIFNYYQCINRRKNNSIIREAFSTYKDSVDVTILNEVLGKSPQKLYQLNKLISCVYALYSDKDIDVCKEIRLHSRLVKDEREISDVFKKHLLILAPEWYDWLKENNYEKLFCVDLIFQYDSFMKNTEEYYNNFTGYYLDMNAPRPFFKDGVRNGFVRKQKEKEILNDLVTFLYK